AVSNDGWRRRPERMRWKGWTWRMLLGMRDLIVMDEDRPRAIAYGSEKAGKVPISLREIEKAALGGTKLPKRSWIARRIGCAADDRLGDRPCAARASQSRGEPEKFFILDFPQRRRRATARAQFSFFSR